MQSNQDEVDDDDDILRELRWIKSLTHPEVLTSYLITSGAFYDQ